MSPFCSIYLGRNHACDGMPECNSGIDEAFDLLTRTASEEINDFGRNLLQSIKNDE